MERVRQRRPRVPRRRRHGRGPAQHPCRARARPSPGPGLTNPAPTRRPKDRKAGILAAAADLFAQRGFAAIGIDDIGARVGVTGPAIYRHFPGKDAVLVALLESAAADLATAFEEAARRPGDRLENVMRAAAEHILDHPSATAAYLRERPGLRGATPKLADAERRVRAAWRAGLTARAEVWNRPRLDRVRLGVRQQAVVGALTAAVRGPRRISRPRLDDLLVRSGLAVMTAPVAAPATLAQPEPPPGPTRRDAIVDAALPLFRRRGVNGVGVDEIGAAAGISGPTVYHYFPSKSAIVLAAYDRAGERVEAGMRAAVAEGGTDHDVVARLVAGYAAVACDSVDLIVVTSREDAALPEADRPRLRRRLQAVRDGWAAAVAGVRPDLGEAEVRLLVSMTFPLVNAAAEAAEADAALVGEVAAIAYAHLTM